MLSVSFNPTVTSFKAKSMGQINPMHQLRFGHKKDVNYAVPADQLPEGASLIETIRPLVCSHCPGLIGATEPYVIDAEGNAVDPKPGEEALQDYYITGQPAVKSIVDAFVATGKLKPNADGTMPAVIQIPKKTYTLLTAQPTH